MAFKSRTFKGEEIAPATTPSVTGLPTATTADIATFSSFTAEKGYKYTLTIACNPRLLSAGRLRSILYLRNSSTSNSATGVIFTQNNVTEVAGAANRNVHSISYDIIGDGLSYELRASIENNSESANSLDVDNVYVSLVKVPLIT